MINSNDFLSIVHSTVSSIEVFFHIRFYWQSRRIIQLKKYFKFNWDLFHPEVSELLVLQNCLSNVKFFYVVFDFMSEHYDRLKYLLNQYSSQSSTQCEENELFDLLNISSEAEVEPLQVDILEQTEPIPDESRKKRLLEKILLPLITEEEEVLPSVRRISSWWKIAVAASVILLLSFATYFFFNNNPVKQTEIAKPTIPNDVEAPKGTKAMITLANGKKVMLDSLLSPGLSYSIANNDEVFYLHHYSSKMSNLFPCYGNV